MISREFIENDPACKILTSYLRENSEDTSVIKFYTVIYDLHLLGDLLSEEFIENFLDSIPLHMAELFYKRTEQEHIKTFLVMNYGDDIKKGDRLKNAVQFIEDRFNPPCC